MKYTVALLVLFAQATVAGEWATSLVTPRGDMTFTLVIMQDGSKLSGRMSSEMGEFPLKGTVDGNRIRLEWSFPDGGKMLAVKFAGTVDKNSLSGLARLGDVGDGPMTAERRGGP